MCNKYVGSLKPPLSRASTCTERELWAEPTLRRANLETSQPWAEPPHRERTLSRANLETSQPWAEPPHRERTLSRASLEPSLHTERTWSRASIESSLPWAEPPLSRTSPDSSLDTRENFVPSLPWAEPPHKREVRAEPQHQERTEPRQPWPKPQHQEGTLSPSHLWAEPPLNRASFEPRLYTKRELSWQLSSRGRFYTQTNFSTQDAQKTTARQNTRVRFLITL